MSGVLQGRVAVVTGGTGALGTAVTGVFARAGARVHVPWLDGGELPAFREVFTAEGLLERVRLHRADVTDPSAVERLFATVIEEEDAVDVLVNAVGGFSAADLVDTDPGLWDRMMALNARSAFLCSRAAAGAMGERGGRIINVAARPALDRGAAGMSAYAASKAAVLNLTLSLSKELSRRGITVNAVVPTIIDTPANRRDMPGADRSRWLQAEEIAAVMRFLASDEAAVVTGAVLALGKG